MSNPTRWTYQVVTVKPSRFLSLRPSDADLADAANRHGAGGWELVSAIPSSSTHYVQMLFKRPQ